MHWAWSTISDIGHCWVAIKAKAFIFIFFCCFIIILRHSMYIYVLWMLWKWPSLLWKVLLDYKFTLIEQYVMVILTNFIQLVKVQLLGFFGFILVCACTVWSWSDAIRDNSVSLLIFLFWNIYDCFDLSLDCGVFFIYKNWIS